MKITNLILCSIIGFLHAEESNWTVDQTVHDGHRHPFLVEITQNKHLILHIPDLYAFDSRQTDKWLLALVYDSMQTGSWLVCIDKLQHKVMYVIPSLALGSLDHSQYRNRAYLSVLDKDDIVVISGKEGYGEYVEMRDIATGNLLSYTSSVNELWRDMINDYTKWLVKPLED